jgi:hypothetical protein
MSWGGKREGAGRPRGNGYVRSQVASGGGTRSTIYRGLRRGQRLTPEAMDFATADGTRHRMITGKALDIAGEFDTAAEQIAALEFAIEQRKARRRLSLAETIRHIHLHK